MKRSILTLTATLLAATSASAMMMGDLDIDGDGFATKTEILMIFPDFRSSDFRAIDLNDDNRISEQEIQSPGVNQVISRYESSASIVHSISEIDQDGDRFVTMAELAAVYNGLTDGEFGDIDTNDDNRVSANELYAPLAQALVTRHEMSPTSVVTIMSVDTDNDFFASFNELKSSFPGLSQLDFQEIDMNNDNRVASKEFYMPGAQTILRRSGS